MRFIFRNNLDINIDHLTDELDALVYGGLDWAAQHRGAGHSAGQITPVRAIWTRPWVRDTPLATEIGLLQLMYAAFYLPGITVILETLKIKLEFSTNLHCVRSLSATQFIGSSNFIDGILYQSNHTFFPELSR